MIRYVLLGCLTCAAWSQGTISRQPYMIESWHIEDGLPQNSVYALTQTSDGYIWLGTQEGLVRYDGVRFVVFDTRTTAELKHNWIYVLYEDRDRALWIGTQGGGVTRLNDGRFTTFRISEGLAGDWVYDILQDRDGVIWVATNGGLSRWVDGKWSTLSGIDDLPSHSVRVLWETRDGSLWFGTTQGLNRFSSGRIASFKISENAVDNSITALCEDTAGTLWIGTGGGGIGVIKSDRVVLQAQFASLSGNRIWKLYADREGNIWIGHNGRGLSCYTGDRITAYSSALGLSDDRVLSILEDREGSLWIGTSGGLNQMRHSQFHVIGQLEGLSNEVVFPILQTRSGDMWIGTEGGLFRLVGNRVQSYGVPDGLPGKSVFALCEDRDDRLWIGTNRGLASMDGGQLRQWTSRHGVPDAPVQSIHHHVDGRVWISFEEAGLVTYAEGRFQRVPMPHGSTDAFEMASGRDSALWMATNNGLIRYHRGQWTTFNVDSGLSHNAVRTIHEDSDGTLWIGTRGGGLNRYRDGRWSSYTTDNGLFDNLVYRILEDRYGMLWMSCNKGIFRVSKRALNDVADGTLSTLTCVSYGKADGMRSRECNGGFQPAGWKSSDGRLWFPTLKGAVVVDPDQLGVREQPPVVVIEDMRVDGISVPWRGSIAIPPDKRNIEIQYAGLSFLAVEKLHFRYRLFGFDDDWVDAGPRRSAFYTSVPPGRYRFEVAASVGLGTWSDAAVLPVVTVIPRFYQTWWFVLGCGAALAGFLFVGHSLRVSHLKKRELRLGELVQQRTQSLEAEKATSERQALELKQANQIKNEIIGIVAHDLKNPLTTIMGYASLLYDHPNLSEEDKKEVQHIVVASERMDHIISQLLQIAAIDAGNLSLHLDDVHLSQVLHQLIAQYSRMATRKNQTIHFDLDDDVVIRGDSEKVKSITENLMSNAIKYTPKNGTIRVRLSRNGNMGQLAVEDEGPGIRDEEFPRLFQRWSRLSAKPTGGETSTGLGLSIVRQFVDLHSGRIHVENRREGAGSRFVVELPLSEV